MRICLKSDVLNFIIESMQDKSFMIKCKNGD